MISCLSLGACPRHMCWLMLPSLSFTQPLQLSMAHSTHTHLLSHSTELLLSLSRQYIWWVSILILPACSGMYSGTGRTTGCMEGGRCAEMLCSSLGPTPGTTLPPPQMKMFSISAYKHHLTTFAAGFRVTLEAAPSQASRDVKGPSQPINHICSLSRP